MSQFTRLYPARGQVLFDGGLNTKFARAIIEDNESPDCLNVIFTNGAVETREGTVKLNTAAIGSFVGDGLYTRRANNNSETMVAFAGGTMWQLVGTSFTTVPSAQSVFTLGARVSTAQYENHMFIGNGGVIPYKWNGAEFTRHGVYPPTTTSTVASQNTGVLTGDYRYKVTYINSQSVESDVGPVTATFTAASATLRVTSLPVAPTSFGVNARRIYRTEAGGTTFKRLATISDNSTTTYDDTTADASLGAAAPTDNGVPPKYSIVIYHQNRLFMDDPANPNLVWYTNLGEPYTVASTNFFKVGDKTTDLVKGFGVFDNALVTYCEGSETVTYMPSTDPSDWKHIVSKSPYGTKSPHCILDYNNKQLFPAVQDGKFVGFAAFSGNTVEPSSTFLSVLTAGSNLKSDRIETDMFDVQESYLGNISGIVYKNKAYITLTKGSGNTTNNRIYVFDFSMSNLRKNQKESWAPWSGLNAAQFTIYSGNLYYISSTATGFVYRMNAGVYNDDGAAINSYYWTKEFSGNPSESNIDKDFRFANILADKAGDYYMNFTFRTDSDTGDGSTQQIDLDPGGSLWGTMMWGRDNWGGGKAQEEIRIPIGGARGKRIQMKFSNQNQVNQRFKIHWLTKKYNLKGAR